MKKNNKDNIKNSDLYENAKHQEIDKEEKAKRQIYLRKIFLNVLKAIAIMLYFVLLNVAYINLKQEVLIKDIEIFSIAFLVFGLVELEIAYKKDDGSIVISAVELLLLAFHNLSIMHVITMYKYDFRLYLLTSSYVFSIYYILKSIIIYTKERKEYLNTLNDISEIVKKDEPIKKEAKKQSKNSAKEK